MREEIPMYNTSRSEAERYGDEELWDRSFTENVACARAIERAIRAGTEENGMLRPNCIEPVIAEYGLKRTQFVLAHSVRMLGKEAAASEETKTWCRGFRTVTDAIYGRYFAVKAEPEALEAFIRQAREAFQAIGLFGRDRYEPISEAMDLTGRVLVLSPDTLKESAWQQENQLWLAESGFGCSPNARGRAVYATCLGDGEQARWNRGDFIGVLDERFLPDWAKPRLAELRGQTQDTGMTMSGIQI